MNDLKNENERIKQMLISYQLKDEKHSIAERKLKLQVYKAEKEKKTIKWTTLFTSQQQQHPFKHFFK